MKISALVFITCLFASTAPAQVNEQVVFLNKNRNATDTIGIYSPHTLPSQIPQVKFRNDEAKFSKKLARAELIVGGGTSLVLGGLILMPRSITFWERSFLDNGWNNLKTAFTKPPVWDSDLFVLNYIGHPYAGAFYYNAIRSQGGTRFQSIAFTTLQSALWEYVLEGVAERTSIQDLVVTPVLGTLLGEAAHHWTLKAGRNGFSFGEKVLLLVFNPMYVANNGFKLHIRKPSY